MSPVSLTYPDLYLQMSRTVLYVLHLARNVPGQLTDFLIRSDVHKYAVRGLIVLKLIEY